MPTSLKPFDFLKFESTHKLVVNQRYKYFIDNEIGKYSGCYIYIPTKSNYKSSVKLLNPSYKLFEDLKVTIKEHDKTFLPLARLDPQTSINGLAVNIVDARCPVFFINHVNNAFELLYESLDDFLNNFLDKKDQTPYEYLDNAVNKAANLINNSKSYKKALQILIEVEEQAAFFLKFKQLSGHAKIRVQEYLNFRGICHMEINDVNEALSHYKQAINLDDVNASLNLIEYLIKDKDYKKAYNFSNNLLNTISKYNSYHNQFYAQLFYGIINIHLGNKNNAKIAFEIIGKNKKDFADFFDIGSKYLLELIETKPEHWLIAQQILEWFPNNTMQEEVQKNQETAIDVRIEQNSVTQDLFFYLNTINEIDSIELSEEVGVYTPIIINRGSIIDIWPDDIYCTIKGWKRITNLPDAMLTSTKRNIIISNQLKQYLTNQKLKDVEFLPIKIMDYKQQLVGNYYLLNFLGVKDCLNKLATNNENKLIIDESKIDNDVQLFKVDYNEPILIRKGLVNRLIEQGFLGLCFQPVNL